MPTIWGAVSEVSDLGVVAEHCPHCEQLMPCLLRSVNRGDYVLFVKMAVASRESSLLCTGCLKSFPGEPSWRYASVLPIHEAKALPVEELLTRTNPGLAERLQFKEQICALGGDARFATAYGHLEAMRPGPLRSELSRRLRDWDRLDEEQRASLSQHICSRARAFQFARQIAPSFPGSAGCLTLAAIVAVVTLVFFFVPVLQNWTSGIIQVIAALMGTALVNYLLLTRWVTQWTKKVLIPEAKEANVSLDCFLAVVDDVPGSRLGMAEELWPMKDQIDTIRKALSAEVPDPASKQEARSDPERDLSRR